MNIIMEKSLVYKGLVALALLVVAECAYAQSDSSYYMTIETIDGTKIKMGTSVVKDITFYDGKMLISGISIDSLIKILGDIRVEAKDIKYIDPLFSTNNVDETLNLLCNRIKGSDNILEYSILDLYDYLWGPGSKNQVIVSNLNSKYRYKVRVLGNNHKYSVARYSDDWEGKTYNYFSDDEWHEIPMLSNTTRIVLKADGVEQLADNIRVVKIGLSDYADDTTIPHKIYSVGGVKTIHKSCRV